MTLSHSRYLPREIMEMVSYVEWEREQRDILKLGERTWAAKNMVSKCRFAKTTNHGRVRQAGRKARQYCCSILASVAATPPKNWPPPICIDIDMLWWWSSPWCMICFYYWKLGGPDKTNYCSGTWHRLLIGVLSKYFNVVQCTVHSDGHVYESFENRSSWTVGHIYRY